MIELYKALVGSRATKVNREDSDTDVRIVFVEPTINILSPFRQSKRTICFHEYENNDVGIKAYELSHALHLASKANPEVLEMFMGAYNDKLPGIDGMEPDISFSDELKLAAMVSFDNQTLKKSYLGYSASIISLAEAGSVKHALRSITLLNQGIQLAKFGAFVFDTSTYEYASMLENLKKHEVLSGKILDGYKVVIADLRSKLEQACDEKVRVPNIALVENIIMTIRKYYWKLVPLAETEQE